MSWFNSHYPSWGSGTTESFPGAPGTLLSLPLMGIRNVCWSQAIPARALAHYPSWGSGTPVKKLDHLMDCYLITPHGDQEPGRSTTRTGMGASSLPLMGIRNWPAVRAASPRLRSHYPSWGSGTRMTFSPSRIASISLPLMGIRNPCRADIFEATYENSLPLMGIRNSSKAAMLRMNSEYSLPLMGIRNRRRPGERSHQHGDLITPHGDQERARSSEPRGRCRPHYPSWGSGTAGSWRACATG